MKLAAMSGVPKSSIHGWMASSEQEKINVIQLNKVCAALRVGLYELLFSKPDPHGQNQLKSEILRELFTGDVRITIHKVENPNQDLPRMGTSRKDPGIESV